MSDRFPTGYRAQQREREKLEALILKLQGWKDGFSEDERKAEERVVAARGQKRITEASSMRYSLALADKEVAVNAADSASGVIYALRNLLNSPATKTPHPASASSEE